METASGLQAVTSALSWPDLAVFASILGVVVVIAYLSGRKEANTTDFFLGGRRVPTVVACLSFIATEVSAMTIVGVPAAAFRENWHYLQFFLGSAASRVIVSFLFIPVFYKYNCTTIYEFLKHRFGQETQYAGSVFFFITRLLASAVRLLAACIGVSGIMGWQLWEALLLFTLVSIGFIAFGGIKAVVWTGAFESIVFYGAGIVVVGYLFSQIHGTLAEAWHTAADAGRLSLLNLNWSLGDPKTLWGATLNGFFVGLCVFGTDQELMQRLLTVRTRGASQRALLWTIVAGLPLTATYLLMGTLLFIYYRQHTALAPPENSDHILSHFVVNVLPFGLKGLVLAAVVLASIDSPLSSLASSFVTDIYRPLHKRPASERHYLWVSRGGVVAFGVLLALLAFLCRRAEGILWLGFQVLTVTGGSTLGVFLLGLLTRRRVNRGNVVAMVASALTMLALLVLSEGGTLKIGWTWLIVFGTGMTFGLGYLFGRPQAEDAQS
jgi:SSS family solute:Na+ symporter